MNNKTFINTVINKYSNPLEIEFLKRMAGTGLEDYEEIIIDTYFKTNGKVLVVGCGAGRESFVLGKKKYFVAGIDIVEDLAKISLKESNKLGFKSFFFTMNASCLGFKSNTFDYVLLLSQVLSLIPLRKNRIETLKECKRVLKEDGILICTTHSRDRNFKEKIRWKVINFIRKITTALIPGKYMEKGDKWVVAISGYKISPEKIFIHLYTPEEAIEDIASAGLKVIDYKSSIEVVNKRSEPKIREKDKYIIYVCNK